MEYFNKMCLLCPEMFVAIKKNILQKYNDDWINFKTVLLNQIDYFHKITENYETRYFCKEIQFYMDELVF